MAPPPDRLTFTTPRKERLAQPVSVTFCGEEFTVQRPKDSVLFAAQVVAAGDVVGPDRAAAILQFLNSTLEAQDRYRYFARVIDRADPVNLSATIELVAELARRWGDWPADGDVAPVVIEPSPTPSTGQPVEIVHEELDLEFVCHPPKDVILLFTAASLATGAAPGQQAWAIALFLDASLSGEDALMVATRLKDTRDDLDLGDIAEIVMKLMERWGQGLLTNRAARRAAARRRD
jgi:hypothetical protein